ncbi:MAG: lipoprotein-releasing system ATP-binding protein LolD [Chthoniobacterales bacterium]|nr:MAG: lipoprotein-releasing system ATP-binding protein LolD [Chthoniobacterales bacterium]
MISLVDVHRHYTGNGREVRAVDGVSLEIARHEFVALSGPSGCGKSTLMHLLAGIDRPSRGEIYVDGLALHRADETALTRYRREQLGIVFQFFNLLPTMTALENVMFPLLLQGVPRGRAEERAGETLALVGLAERAEHFAHQLSGGEQQRTAIARAIVHRPQLLIADEPTGNLDSGSTESVMGALRRVAEEKLATLIIVTHSEEIARAASRRVRMRDGRVEKG